MVQRQRRREKDRVLVKVLEDLRGRVGWRGSGIRAVCHDSTSNVQEGAGHEDRRYSSTKERDKYSLEAFIKSTEIHRRH